MRSLIQANNSLWDPFDLLADFHGDWTQRFSPSLEVQEEGDNFLVQVDLPGISKENLNVSIEGDLLTIQGERKHEKKLKSKDYHYSERNYGSFSRTIQLPAEVETSKVQAAYKNGVLNLTLPKSERAKAKQINVDIK